MPTVKIADGPHAGDVISLNALSAFLTRVIDEKVEVAEFPLPTVRYAHYQREGRVYFHIGTNYSPSDIPAHTPPERQGDE